MKRIRYTNETGQNSYIDKKFLIMFTISRDLSIIPLIYLNFLWVGTDQGLFKYDMMELNIIS